MFYDCGWSWKTLCKKINNSLNKKKIWWAVKLKIFREEWDYCFNVSFVEVLDFVKYVWNLEILKLKPNNIKCCFCKCFLYYNFILKLLPQTWHLEINLHDFLMKKTCQAMQCQKCCKYFKKKQESQMPL